MVTDTAVRLVTIGVLLVTAGLAMALTFLLTYIRIYLEVGLLVFAIGFVLLLVVVRLD